MTAPDGETAGTGTGRGRPGGRGAPSRTPLAGRSALIAGASRGIGAAVARELAGAGARTTLLARSTETLEAVARETGGRALPADLSDASSVEDAVQRLVDGGGGPDVVVNAAGVFDLAPLHDTDLETLDRNLGVNLRGAFLLVRAVLPAMLERGNGLIVNVGSVAGRKALPGNAAYSASKYGLRGMHEVLLEEIRGTGVRATLVEPGAVDTGIWDSLEPDDEPDLPSRDEMLEPRDVAEAVRFVATRGGDVQIPVLPIEAV